MSLISVMRTFCALAAFAMPGVSAATAQALDGVWKTGTDAEGGYLHVRLHPCGAQFCGDIVSAFEAGGIARPDYEHMGRNILWDIVPNDRGGFAGMVWAPDTEKTYKAKLEFKSMNLEVSGCVVGGLICRSQLWTREQ